MRRMKYCPCFLIAFAIMPTASHAGTPTSGVTAQAQAAPLAKSEPSRKTIVDWPQLKRYGADDAALASPAPGMQRVVFLGDSITDAWGRSHGKFFPGKPYVNRGISGQTTPQMLLRFQQDVIALKPAVVVILAGTNDVAENTGPETLAQMEDNFRSMATLAKANHIHVVLSSTLPATHFPWNPAITDSAEKIKTLNAWLERFCGEHGFVFLNYYPALVNDAGGMRKDLTTDGYVHPNDAGYAIMEPLAQAAINQALRAPLKRRH
jgi:lysophospholipase L1-like esterase